MTFHKLAIIIEFASLLVMSGVVAALILLVWAIFLLNIMIAVFA